jgi:hypothetical protein
MEQWRLGQSPLVNRAVSSEYRLAEKGPALTGALCMRIFGPEIQLVEATEPGALYFDFLAESAGRAIPHGSYFSLGSGIFSSAAL